MSDTTEKDAWSCHLCGLSSPHVHGPDADLMSSVIPAAETAS